MTKKYSTPFMLYSFINELTIGINRYTPINIQENQYPLFKNHKTVAKIDVTLKEDVCAYVLSRI